MKIFYLPGHYDGCYYYRGYLPGTYSNQMVVSNFTEREFDTGKITEMSKKADVVVIQRPNEPKRAELAKLLKQQGKKVIFENDDTYLPDKGIPMHLLENDKQREVARKLSQLLNETLEIADGAIASTETLAKEYSEINDNVLVAKNCIDPLDEFVCKKNTTGKFRIGLIGSVTTNDDYVHIKDQLKQLDDRGDITIVLFGLKFKDGSELPACKNDFAFWNSLKNVEWQPFVPVTDYYMTIANLALDLAIIPRKESYFNQCKSNLKFLEMSLLNIPVLAQGFTDNTSPYQGVDEEYMSILVGSEGWYDKIVEIKDNYKQYKELANKAHDYVLKDYNIETYAPEWTKAIEKLCSK
jgi:glycosyltransferase involved in cell wall biosynthesis